MNDQSDLDLVAQAMAPTEPKQHSAPAPKTPPRAAPSFTAPPPPPTSPPSTDPRPNSKNNDPPATATATVDNADNIDDTDEVENPLEGIDLSTLSPADLTLLQPIIAALNLNEQPDVGNEKGQDEQEQDGLRIADILAQMDAADNVADELEGKLDKLLENLGMAEKEMEKEVVVDGGDAEDKRKKMDGETETAEETSVDKE